MANYSELLNDINAAIYENNDQEIDALEVRAILREMVTSLGSGFLFKGIATPSSPSGTGTYEPDQNVFYLATTAGTYTYLGGLVVAAGEVAFLCFDGTWTKKSSALLSTGSIVDNTTTDDATKPLSAKQGKVLADAGAATAAEVTALGHEVSDLDLEVNGKAAVNITGAIPMVGGTGNVRATGAYCLVNIPAGSYYFTIDTNYIGINAVVHAVINGTNTSLGSVNDRNNSVITFAGDVTEINVWANASNSPATGDCAFSFSQDSIRGITDDISDLNDAAKKVNGVDTSATANIPVLVEAQLQTQTKTEFALPAGSYYIDIVNPTLFRNNADLANLYVWKKDGTQVSLGIISPAYSDYWVSGNNDVYLRDATFDADIAYIGVYHAVNIFASAGDLQLKFTQKNPLLSFDQKIEKNKDKGISAQTSFSGSETLATGEVLALPDVCTEKNFCLAAEIDGTISEVNVGVGYDATKGTERCYTARWLKISPTTIEVWYNTNEDHLADTYTHGLTLDDKTCISIVRGSTGTATLRMYTKLGAVYEVELSWPNGQGAAFVENLGNTSIDARITFTPRDLTKQIWIFGDSACGFGLNRWPGQMLAYGFDNFLMCARSGDAQKDGFKMLQNLLNLGRVPVYIVWSLGGNGPGDTPNGDPAGYQKLWLYNFLRLCDYYQITPILTTVASFQSAELKHHGWSDYIRGLGYRYIDMADAVGSQQDGSSYPGMFGPDGIHHSVEGARMVAQRVLLDFPEIAVSEN